MEALFILSIVTIFVIYVLYGPIMVLFKWLKTENDNRPEFKENLPTISLIIPAFNEEGWINSKIKNSLSLDYPKNKLEVIVVTDGSTDKTSTIVSAYSDQVMLLNSFERNGKISAMDRASRIANNDILVFTDANTELNENCLKNIAKHFHNPRTGMVSGEKKVIASRNGESASGEGLYWKYESWLKTLDSEVASVIGAAGELFAIRSSLYEKLPSDTLLDDFMLSSRLLEKGYKVVYEPNAIALEYGSASYKEEWKRKVRICAGGIQSIKRSAGLFNIRLYGLVSFAFIVHRVSRWTIAPLALLTTLFSSLVLRSESIFYFIYFIIAMASLALTFLAVQKNLKNLPKPLLLIVYFTFMHISAIAGWFRYFGKTQSVNWERAARLKHS